jgi:hypothetical protein
MPYIVEVMLSKEAWEQALIEATPLLGDYVEKLDKLTPTEESDVLRMVMQSALARHHQWLADRGIGAVISPVEAVEWAFDFEFAYGPDALLFLQEFNGKLRAGTL